MRVIKNIFRMAFGAVLITYVGIAIAMNIALPFLFGPIVYGLILLALAAIVAFWSVLFKFICWVYDE